MEFEWPNDGRTSNKRDEIAASLPKPPRGVAEINSHLRRSRDVPAAKTGFEPTTPTGKVVLCP
jgi:hypothetical protein